MSQLIQFEGCTVAVIAPEDLEAQENELAALRARVAELAQLLDEGSAYVHSFAMLSKHPTAPAYAMDLAQRMRAAAGLSGNKPEVPK